MRQPSRSSGPVLALLAVGGLALAVVVAGLLDPTVRLLPVRARLSDLGRPGAPGAVVFGAGLAVAGLLGLAAVRSWWRAARTPLDRATAALAGAAFLGLGVAGLFPAPSPVHTPALAAAYLAGWSAPLLDGLGLRPREPVDRAAGRSRTGTAILAGATVVALLWAVRAVVATTFVLSGPTGAILPAELATLALFGGWVVVRGRRGGSLAATPAGVSAAGR